MMIEKTRPLPAEERHHAMAVATGLYFLRYVSAPQVRNYPSITVNQHPHNPDIALLPQPGHSETQLQAPGDYMVVRANAPGTLNFVVVADRPGAGTNVEIRLERIAGSSAKPGRASRKTPSLVEPVSSENDEITVLAHVSRRGDVLAEAGEWICGPALPLPIEGIEIRWPQQPQGVELHYSAINGRVGREFPAKAGQFAGTRGKAASLTGLELSLSGPAGANYELRGEALFLGAAVVAQLGREVSFSGPSGREPLVGFRVEVVRARSKSLHKNEAVKALRQEHPGKVRVYRSASVASRSNDAINQL